MKWKCFPHYQPFVQGIHWSFPSQRLVIWSFDVSFRVSLNKLLNKWSNCYWDAIMLMWYHCIHKILAHTMPAYSHQGPDSIKRCHLTSIGNPIVEIGRSYDRLISPMGFPILVRWHLYIESRPSKHSTDHRIRYEIFKFFLIISDLRYVLNMAVGFSLSLTAFHKDVFHIFRKLFINIVVLITTRQD